MFAPVFEIIAPELTAFVADDVFWRGFSDFGIVFAPLLARSGFTGLSGLQLLGEFIPLAGGRGLLGCRNFNY